MNALNASYTPEPLQCVPSLWANACEGRHQCRGLFAKGDNIQQEWSAIQRIDFEKFIQLTQLYNICVRIEAAMPKWLFMGQDPIPILPSRAT